MAEFCKRKIYLVAPYNKYEVVFFQGSIFKRVQMSSDTPASNAKVDGVI